MQPILMPDSTACWSETLGDGGTPREETPFVEPAAEVQVNVNEHSLLGLAELLLKQPARVDGLTREETRQPELIPRFLAISLCGFALFAVALVLLFNMAPLTALPFFLAKRWSAGGMGPGLSLGLAYTAGLVAANGVCLPSFYFYCLLAGVKISVLQVTAHCMRAMAASAVTLLGVLPIYVAIGLGMIVFNAPPTELQYALYLGLALPFLAGLAGVRSLYMCFVGLADTLPARTRVARECFLRRLTAAMAACYTAVTPVMIYTLWTYFADRI
jgi:hypothetical protein